MRRINLLNTKAVRIMLSVDRFELKEEAVEWLNQHNISDYQLTHTSFDDRLGPFIEFGDNVPESFVNWFMLRFSL